MPDETYIKLVKICRTNEWKYGILYIKMRLRLRAG